MWILNFLPDLVFHLVLGLGLTLILISWFLNFIPGLKSYGLPIQVVGIILTCGGIWYEGGIAKDKEWSAKVEEAKKKIIELENRGPIVNTQVITKYKTEVQVVKEKGETITEYITDTIVKYDNSCPIPNEVITAHNLSAQNKSAKGNK